MEHFFPQIQVKTKKKEKKGLYRKRNTFSPLIQVDTYAQMYTRVKLLGGDADVDHTQTIGGILSNYWGDVSSLPSGFGTPAYYLFTIILHLQI